MLLAHDLGTTGDKASLHEDDGTLVASVTVEYPTDYASGGIAEQDPEQWWRAVCDATRRLLDDVNASPGAVAAVGFSGQMMGLVCLDRDLRPVRPAIIWADTRSRDQAEQVLARVPMAEAYRITGHRLNPTYSLTKLMWVREHEPDAFARTHLVCQAKDFVVARLTGRVVTDASDASSTNAFDQGAGTWSSVLLDAAGLDPELFPEVLASPTVAGEITADAARQCGLRAGTAVVIGGGDGPLAAVGAGVLAPEDGAYMYLGSSSWISSASPTPLHDPQMRTMTFNHAAPGMFVPTATMVAGGGSLQWATEAFGEPGSPVDVSRLLNDVSSVRAAEEGLFFLPHLLGERSPYWNPAARGGFIGVQRHHDRRHLARAVLEGVAFNLLTCLRAFQDCGATITRVDAIGGGAKSDAWLQLMADAFGVPVRRRTIVDEANSLGAAVVAGVAVGTIPDLGRARDLSEVTAELVPDRSRTDAVAAAHRRFGDLYAALEPWFEGAL